MGFNDCQENWIPAKRAIQILTRNIKRYYKVKEDKASNSEDVKLIYFDSAGDVLVPPDLYTSKVLDDIDILIVNTNFRSNYMSKIEKNIEDIQKK